MAGRAGKHGHHATGARHGNWNGGRTRHQRGYMQVAVAGHPRANMRGYVFEHILVAERALGHAIPPGASVHHVNEIKDDNRPGNLIICDSLAYHNLLHQRMRAVAACGNASWRSCRRCHQYDDPDNMRDTGGTMEHRECGRAWARARKALRRAA